MGSDFRAEVADYYARYRRGYPAAAVDAIAGAFRLGAGDLVVDLIKVTSWSRRPDYFIIV